MLGLGVLTALLARDRHGVTQSVWTSQLNPMMWLQYYNAAQYLNMGADFAPYDRTKVANPLRNHYRCKDGQWIACGMAVAQRFWPEFCQVMGLAELEQHPRFATDDKRAAHRTELIALIDRAFAAHPRDHWELLFREKGFWFSVVNRVSDLPSDPQGFSNDYLVELDNGLKRVPSPFQLEKNPAPLKKGHHHSVNTTDEILQEVCGYTMEEILALKAEGVAW